MSGVFLSYSRGDRALADRIIRALRAVGVEVWWDEDMRGVDWQDELARQITRLDAVMVLWTEISAGSKNVRDEARLGLNTEKLINVMAGAASPPFPYDRVNGLPIDGWTGREPHRGWTRLVSTIEEKIVAAGGAKPGDITGALARREERQRLGREAVEAAQSAFQEAQQGQIDTDAAAKAAAEAVSRAEEQLQGVIEIRGSTAIRHAAQAELDTVVAAKERADKACQDADTRLSAASRAMARAKRELEALFDDAGAPAISPDMTSNPPPEPASEVASEAELATTVTVDPPAPPAVAEPSPTPEPQSPSDVGPPQTISAEPAPPVGIDRPPLPIPPPYVPAPPGPFKRVVLLMFDAKGRIPRRDYWIGAIVSWGFFYAVYTVWFVVNEPSLSTNQGAEPITSLALMSALAVFAWNTAVIIIKRAHDRGQSGWMALVYMIPVFGWAWALFELGFRKGVPEANRFGPAPTA